MVEPNEEHEGVDVWDALIQRLADEGVAEYVPQTDDELWEYVRSEYGFEIPRTPVCATHTSPFQALADAFFDRVQDCIWIGPRAGGKTLQFALLDHLLFFHFGVSIANVGAIDIQAQKCYSYFEQFATKPQFKHKLLKPPMLSRTYSVDGALVEIMPATMNRVNSPHPNRAHLDEIELMDPRVLEEAKAMPIRQNGRRPATIWTSSRKKASGPMEALLTEAPERGIPVYKWCVMELAEACPQERHQNGEGCRACPLHDICKEKTVDEEGIEQWTEGPGRLARARGWMSLEDIEQKYRTMDFGVFDSQMLSNRPETSGLAYPMFDEDVHVIDYEYHPAYPVVAGIDWGYVNPSVCLYAQATPNDEIVIFAEDYRALRTEDVFCDSVQRTPWYANTNWFVADSEDAGAIATFRNRGVPVEGANKNAGKNESSVTNGIKLVRFLLKPSGRPKPLLYISRKCKNTLREIRAYHNPDAKNDKNPSEVPAKVDDHAMDALRYLIMRLFRGQLVT